MRRSNTCNFLVRIMLPGLGAIALLNGCASTPREVASQPVQVRLESKTVMSLPGLAPRLVTYSDKRTVFVLHPSQQWRMPRMSRPQLQEMVAHCDEVGGRQVLQVRRAVLEDGEGTVLATLLDSGSVTLPELSRHTDGTVAMPAQPVDAVLRLAIDPDRFHGQLREELELVFRDAEAQIVPGVQASIQSMTTTPQHVTIDRRTASINYLYVKLDNRGRKTYLLNGHDSGAMEAGASRMLTADSAHASVLAPGRSLIVRLPIELSQPLEPGRQTAVALDDYLTGWNGVIGPEVAAQVPLRVQIELQADSRAQRGVLTPTMQVQKRYHVERAGCFD